MRITIKTTKGHPPYSVVAWTANGQYHRLDGPAYEVCSAARVEYWQEGLLHRDDGPAVVSVLDGVWYWYRGKHVSKDQMRRKAKRARRLRP